MKQWLREKRPLVDRAAETAFSIMPPSLYMGMKRGYFKLSRSKKELQKIRTLKTVNPSVGMSFKPFDDAKAIFVHVPKCAGDSISLTLFGNFSGSHTTLSEYINVFEPECMSSYFKFAFVRNPWDRLVSAFHYLKRGGWEEDGDWFIRELGHFKDFDEFVKGWMTKDNIWKREYFRPQYHYILERKGKLQIDFIGFFENLEEDFGYITKRLGVDRQLLKSNKGNQGDYRSFYNDETMKIVADVYEADIKLLGYNFDNSSLPAQLVNRSSGRALNLTAPGLHKGDSQHF
jgi:hypothetical protein